RGVPGELGRHVDHGSQHRHGQECPEQPASTPHWLTVQSRRMPTRLILLAALALLCASCGFKQEPTGVLAAYPQSVRDALGHEVRIDAAPSKIVSLDPGMTAAMYELGAQKLLVGRSGAETYPKQAMHLPVMVKNG